MDHWITFILIVHGLGLIWFGALFVRRIPGLWQSTPQFNSTGQWTPAAPYEQQTIPPLTDGLERGRRVITPHLEAGETLEGFAFASFFPSRPKDLKPSLRPKKDRVLIAVTRKRILLFELQFYPQVLLSRCFIGYGELQYLRPPKRGLFGTSGQLRFGLHSGLEYQLQFLGPVIFPEFLRQEQRLAAHLRGLAPRYPSSRPPHAVEPRIAA